MNAFQTTVPFVDLAVQHQQIAAEVMQGFEGVLSRTSFVQGAEVAQFEEEFAQFCGVQHCVGLANGTDAVEFALRALDIGAGSEVILPANTFVATAEAVVRAGARPVLVDCDPDFLIDTAQVTPAMNKRTSAVLAVHLYGQMAPVEILDDLVRGRVPVVEDAAQAQGATRHGTRAGAAGTIAGTSFYPGKNLGAYGDAGAVLTSDDALAATVRRLGSHGGIAKYEHQIVGFNSRLDTLQAVVLLAKLKKLTEWNSARAEAAERYASMLADIPGVTPPRVVPGNAHVWHLYVVRVPQRDEVLKDLARRGIGAGIHYPAPIHLLPAFSWLGYGQGDFPVSETLASQIVSLPMFPGITQLQQEQVVQALADAIRESA